MATHTLPFGATQRCVEQMLSASQAGSPEVIVHGLPWEEFGREVAPGAADAHDVENGVEDALQGASARSTS